MDDNKDLLDLCRLNLMEERIENTICLTEGAQEEHDDLSKMIDWKKRRLVERIKYNQLEDVSNGNK